jgi:hypothetical protein
MIICMNWGLYVKKLYTIYKGANKNQITWAAYDDRYKDSGREGRRRMEQVS